MESSRAVPGPATGSPIPIQADWELLPSGEARNGAQGIAGIGVELTFFTEIMTRQHMSGDLVLLDKVLTDNIIIFTMVFLLFIPV